MTFATEVDAKVEAVGKAVAAGEHVDGWAQGPSGICAQAQDECVDVPGWLRGLDRFPMTGEQQQLIDVITAYAELLFHAIGRLAETYDRPDRPG